MSFDTICKISKRHFNIYRWRRRVCLDISSFRPSSFRLSYSLPVPLSVPFSSRTLAYNEFVSCKCLQNSYTILKILQTEFEFGQLCIYNSRAMSLFYLENCKSWERVFVYYSFFKYEVGVLFMICNFQNIFMNNCFSCINKPL